MKRYLLAALLAGAAFAAPVIRLEPAVITSCRDGLGMARVVWEGAEPGPVTVRAAGAAMTGSEPATGSAETGFWITDGMEFSLTDAAGNTLASTRAVLRCGADRPSWWPLRVGNEWHFRANSRFATGLHGMWRVVRQEQIGAVTWAVLDPAPGLYKRLREDAEGRLFRLTADGREELLLDPSGAPAFWRILSREQDVATPIGVFAEGLSWRGQVVGLGVETGRLGLGIGPLYFESDVVAGSSGGLSDGLTLIEATINGVRYTPDYKKSELIVETSVADITGKKARNCAIPCYYAACGLGSPVDPPGTYKPCVEASIRGGDGTIELINADGNVVFTGQTSSWLRLPLFDAKSAPLPLGQYLVKGTVGTTVLTAPLTVR